MVWCVWRNRRCLRPRGPHHGRCRYAGAHRYNHTLELRPCAQIQCCGATHAYALFARAGAVARVWAYNLRAPCGHRAPLPLGTTILATSKLGLPTSAELCQVRSLRSWLRHCGVSQGARRRSSVLCVTGPRRMPPRRRALR